MGLECGRLGELCGAVQMQGVIIIVWEIELSLLFGKGILKQFSFEQVVQIPSLIYDGIMS